MTDEQRELEDARLLLIHLLKADEFRITEVARTTGRRWFRAFFDHPTEYHLIDHLVDLLERAHDPLRRVPMGDPPGSRGIAFRVVDPSYRDLYIKVKIEAEIAWVLSFKQSDHSGGRSR